MPYPFRDLRGWIDHLEAEGELLRLREEIQLEPDVGAIAKAICEINKRGERAPGILAENIVGCETRLAIALDAAWDRTAIAFGLPKDASLKEQKEAWLKAYARYPVKPHMVNKKDAPCKENILYGEEVDLFKFPIPRLNIQDAGPYLLKTLCITKDPDSDWVNFGMYRAQVLDRNKTSIMTSHTSHWGEHYIKARRKGKPLEMTIVLGTDPILTRVSGTRIPAGWNEFDFAGALRGEPVEVVEAESVGLVVPATAEIVLEGTVTPEANVYEGPFGEWTGAYSGMLVMPTFEIKTLTHRNNPIFDHVSVGRGWTESEYMTLVSLIVALEEELKHICPSISQIAYLQPILENCVVQGRWVNKTEPRRVMNAVWASQAVTQNKIVTIVDEDVDPWDAEEVMWAISTRCQANTDIVMIPGAHCRLDPSVEVDGTTCLLGIDATKSKEPFPRHTIAEWVLPREETEGWRARIIEHMERGKFS
jgi:UbiD family decarboxylase